MKGPKGGGAPPSDYLQLVHDFPLYTITSDEQMDRAHEVIDAVLRRERTPGTDAYLDALSVLVATYEDQAHPMPDAPEADVLRVLMEGNGLSQPQLAREVGIAQSTISDVLSGKKRLTRKQIDVLAAHFNIPSSVFLPESSSAPAKPKARAKGNWSTTPIKGSQLAVKISEALGSKAVRIKRPDPGRKIYLARKAATAKVPKNLLGKKPKASARVEPVD